MLRMLIENDKKKGLYLFFAGPWLKILLKIKMPGYVRALMIQRLQAIKSKNYSAIYCTNSGGRKLLFLLNMGSA